MSDIPPKTVFAFPGSRIDMWVGAVRQDPDDDNSQFVWDRSQTTVLTPLWDPGEPSNTGGNEDHVELRMNIKGGGALSGLNDDIGSKTKKYLCEVDKC